MPLSGGLMYWPSKAPELTVNVGGVVSVSANAVPGKAATAATDSTTPNARIPISLLPGGPAASPAPCLPGTADALFHIPWCEQTILVRVGQDHDSRSPDRSA